MRENSYDVRIFAGGLITAVDARATRSFSRHSHDEFGIGMMTGGAQRSWSGRGQVEAIRGNVITVNPAEPHDGSPLGGGRAWSMLYFSQSFVAPVLADITGGRWSSLELQWPVIDDRATGAYFDAVRRTVIGGEVRDAFEENILSLFAKVFGKVSVPETSSSPALVAVREYIDDDPANHHSLEQHARIAGMTRFATLRGFAKMTGLTPRAYVIQRRLDAARRMIRHGSPLALSAAEAGFADQSHFHRAFVARYGLTPGTYAMAFGREHAISFNRTR